MISVAVLLVFALLPVLFNLLQLLCNRGVIVSNRRT